MPDGFLVTASCLVYDEKTIMIGNSVGSVYFCSINDQKFIKSGLHYSDIIRSIGALLKLVKDPKENPIFKPLVKNADTNCDYSVVSIHPHPYIKFRILIAYANNLVVLYNFEKEGIDAVFDVFSAYNEKLLDPLEPLTVESNKSVIMEAKFSIDSFKIMIALFTGNVMVFAYGT